MSVPHRSRLRFSDLWSLSLYGLRERPLRAVLSSLGIAIGIAAMVSVIGISTSSQARVEDQLNDLGTNLLTAKAGEDLLGRPSVLPVAGLGQTRRLDGVEHAGALATLADVHVYRNEAIETTRTGGLSVVAADPGILKATGVSVMAGTWLSKENSRLPVTVLGRITAERLGITSPGAVVWLGERHFTVVGILEPSALVPELDAMALIGNQVARDLFAHPGNPQTVYVRTDEARVTQVRSLLSATLNPEVPGTVRVSRPSDALAAKNAVDDAFSGLLVGVGSVALLVGGIGVANTMVISVLERRREIGLRRALGATRRHIRVQFLVEAVLLAALGGLAGTALGWGITAATALTNGWRVAVPGSVMVGGVVVTLVVGAVAGLLPAIRAARTSPTAALAS